MPIIAGILALSGSAYRLAITALIGAFGASLPTIIRRVLYSLGVGAVVLVGMESLMGHLTTMALGTLTGVPALALNIFGILQIDTAFNIVTSAYAIKLTIRTLGSSTGIKQISLRSVP